jgi:hypothetical protein
MQKKPDKIAKLYILEGDVLFIFVNTELRSTQG